MPIVGSFTAIAPDGSKLKTVNWDNDGSAPEKILDAKATRKFVEIRIDLNGVSALDTLHVYGGNPGTSPGVKGLRALQKGIIDPALVGTDARNTVAVFRLDGWTGEIWVFNSDFSSNGSFPFSFMELS